MSNYWHCETCDTRNSDSQSYCGKCAGDLPEQIESLESENSSLKRVLENASALIQHIIDMDNLTRGGSTIGWARDVLKEIEEVT